MTLQLVCDGCGEPIDMAASYVVADVREEQITETGAPMGIASRTQHWHVEHAPVQARPGG